MKTVYYEPAGRIHSSQWELIDNPPEGYKFITKKPSLIVRNDFVFDKLRLQILDRLMPLNLVKARLDSFLSMPKADMIFAYNHIVFRKMPWVVLVEWANTLIGRDLRFFSKHKSRIEEALASEHCHGIIVWTEMAKESILLNYNTEGFEDKIRIVPHAIRSTGYVRNYNRGGVNLLFVGSSNTPEDFDAKGAADVIEAFRILKTRHKGLRLTVRAKAPKSINDVPGLTIINQILSKSKLEQLFKEADVFVLPSHFAQEMVIIEAMKYGLPVITSWIGSNCGEYIENDINGLVLPQNETKYFTDDVMLVSETTHRHSLVKYAHNDLEPLVKALARLIESPELREKLGRNAKVAVDWGRFSISHRDKLLKEVLEG